MHERYVIRSVLLIKLIRFLELRNNSDVCRVLKSKKLILWYIKRFIGIFFPSTKFFINWSLMFLSINSSAPINFVICKKYNDWTMKWKFQTLKSAAFMPHSSCKHFPSWKGDRKRKLNIQRKNTRGFHIMNAALQNLKYAAREERDDYSSQ